MPELTTLGDGRPISIGVCEDDHRLRDLLRRALGAEGYRVRCTASGDDAIVAFADDPPQLVVLDISLADRDGLDVCTVLRERGLKVPILFLTARQTLDDRLAAFDAGADDYLTKPFELEELLMRMRSLLRRAATRLPEDSRDLRLDPAAHSAVLGGQTIALTRTEFRILAALLRNRSRTVRRTALARAAWPDGDERRANTLDSCVARLRAKLRRSAGEVSITTVRGVGYVLGCER